MTTDPGDSKSKVELRKQGDSSDGMSVEEKQEDPEELTSQDFKQAADKAQDKVSALASAAQQGVADALGSISEAIVPSTDTKEDPEVKDFRTSAAEAAAQAKAFMQPEAPEVLEARSKAADLGGESDSK